MQHSEMSQIQKYLPSHWQFIFLDSVDSTNSFAKREASTFHPPALIMAHTQTQGRGRGEHKWIGSGDDYFLGSFVLSTNLPPDPRWTMALGYFVYESLSQAFPGWSFSIKAPNDIFLGESKVAGILVESLSMEKHLLIFGLGLNVGAHPLIPGAPATSLKEYANQTGPQDQAHEQINWAFSWSSAKAAFIKRLIEHLEGFETFVAQPHWIAIISEKLIPALNLNPHHRNDPVLSIMEDGSLKMRQQMKNWLDL
jgi:BirA family biotin operon repressor/biotin-[acetyl-CoA-carboxylase] ligase